MRVWAAGISLLVVCAPAVAQTRLTGVGESLHLVNSDLAALESQIPRKDLPCTVKEVDPSLGFDLRFHAGYDVTVPLKELASEENVLSMMFRVTPEAEPGNHTYFVQQVRVPPLDKDAGGESHLSGVFDLGEGKYHVDFIMRDRSERICAYFWDAKAEIPARDRGLEMAIAANSVETTIQEQFLEDSPVERTPGPLLNVKMMVNFAPQNQKSSAMRPIDTLALVTLMRRITREPRVGRFSVVVFNIAEQRIVYRQSSDDRVDFPALGKAIREIEPGVVNARLLENKRGEVEFLTELIRTEMMAPDASGIDRPDALVFAGPKYTVLEGAPEEDLKPVAQMVDYPLFYLNYNLIPQENPWRDSIGRAIRVFNGREYTISRPRDLWFAVGEIVDRILQSKQGRGSSPTDPQ